MDGESPGRTGSPGCERRAAGGTTPERLSLPHGCAPKLAIVRLVQGRPDESLRLMRSRDRGRSGNAALHSKLIGDPGLPSRVRHLRAIKASSRPGSAAWPCRLTARAPSGRRTRSCGSATSAQDFGSGSVARVCRSVIAQADRDRFAIYCYSGAASWDQSSLDLCFRVDAWRTTGRLDDEALETRIRQR